MKHAIEASRSPKATRRDGPETRLGIAAGGCKRSQGFRVEDHQMKEKKDSRLVISPTGIARDGRPGRPADPLTVSGPDAGATMTFYPRARPLLDGETLHPYFSVETETWFALAGRWRIFTGVAVFVPTGDLDLFSLSLITGLRRSGVYGQLTHDLGAFPGLKPRPVGKDGKPKGPVKVESYEYCRAMAEAIAAKRMVA